MKSGRSLGRQEGSVQSSPYPWDEKLSGVLQLWKESAGFHAGLPPCLGDRRRVQNMGKATGSLTGTGPAPRISPGSLISRSSFHALPRCPKPAWRWWKADGLDVPQVALRVARSPARSPHAEESWCILLNDASPSLEAGSKNKWTSEKNQNVAGC